MSTPTILGQFPELRYGSDQCALVFSDSRYTEQVVNLRNNPEVNAHIHNDPLTPAMHNGWLESQRKKGNALNFIILARQEFAGTVSLYDIVPGQKCEYGRLVMPNSPLRIYAIAAEFLSLSFAFEVLRLQEVYCMTATENKNVIDFHLENGWSLAPHYDVEMKMGDHISPHIGFTIDRDGWLAASAKAARILGRLHGRKF